MALARKPAVEQALENLEGEGVLKKITHCEWATPIETPVKKDGSVRVCGAIERKGQYLGLALVLCEERRCILKLSFEFCVNSVQKWLLKSKHRRRNNRRL